MKSFLVLLLLQSTVAFSEQKTPPKDLSILGRIDEESLKKVEPKKPSEAQASESKFSMTCKDSAGKIYKKEEVGYDTCLAALKTQHDLGKMNANGKKSDAVNNASFNYQIGQ